MAIDLEKRVGREPVAVDRQLAVGDDVAFDFPEFGERCRLGG